MATIHINAKDGDFGKVVLMPGDPVRAKWIADTFLHDYKLVNDVRGTLAFTGYTSNGKRISVMASGMGMASVTIYTYELFSSYGVEAIIRVGTAGAYQENINLKDVVIASGAMSDSNIMTPELGNCVRYKDASKELLDIALEQAKKYDIPNHVGNIYSSDVFYDLDPNFWLNWKERGALCVEMEAYALYFNAQRLGKKALCLLTITDSFTKKDEKLTAEERSFGLKRMVDLAVKVAEQVA